jgi:hypothetical protein
MCSVQRSLQCRHVRGISCAYVRASSRHSDVHRLQRI